MILYKKDTFSIDFIDIMRLAVFSFLMFLNLQNDIFFSKSQFYFLKLHLLTKELPFWSNVNFLSSGGPYLTFW